MNVTTPKKWCSAYERAFNKTALSYERTLITEIVDAYVEYVNNENYIGSANQMAYILATAHHESVMGKHMTELGGTSYCQRYEWRTDLGNTQAGDSCDFKGRGPVQLTGRLNYTSASEYLGIDLLSNPERAAEPRIGAKIMIWGMLQGIYTTKSLGMYVNASSADFYNARRVVNGTDKASMIADYAERIKANYSGSTTVEQSVLGGKKSKKMLIALLLLLLAMVLLRPKTPMKTPKMVRVR
jgi:predicted chitinase